MDPKLEFILNRVSKRFRQKRLAWSLAAAWGTIFVALLATYAWFPTLFSEQSYLPLWIGLFIGLSVVVAWLACRVAYRDRRWLAAQIERAYPALNQRLITAVSDRPEGSSRFLRQSLAKETLRHARYHDWRQVVSQRAIRTAWLAQSVLLASVIAIVIFATSNSTAKDRRLFPLTPSIPDASYAIEVEPGHSEIERGTNCLVTVRFPDRIPDRVTLIARDLEDDSIEPIAIPMQRSLNDPIFAGYLTKVVHHTQYQVEFERGASELYTLKVFDYPALMRSDAELTPPEYANQSRRVVKDTRRVTVAEGTSVTWVCNVNKPLASIDLVDADGEVTSLSVDPSNALVYRVTFPMSISKQWKVHLKDHEGRSAKMEETLSVTVLPNKPPELKAEKVTDANVSALEELSVQAKVKDDFGLVRAGVQFNLAGGELQEQVLLNVEFHQPSAGERSDAEQGKRSVAREVSIEHLLDLEAMKSQPDQLVSYSFWAEDRDPAGKIRRVDGEIYFAEVRPFDEIFREGDSAPSDAPSSQQPSSQAQQADELAELQKKIISGTWNVVRGQRLSELTAQAIDDAKVLAESQNDAREKARELGEELRDDQSKKHLEGVIESMAAAMEQLDTAIASRLTPPLKEAVRHEQKAYEGILRLRAREFQISKSQQSQAKSSSASQKNRQRQIDQLELKDDAERYETEKQAAPEEQAADREMRQIMSRLDEIAKRQEDINRQLKDLETAIQAAKTEEEKKELEEQLKRLRENQEELLRDTDDLMDKMESTQQPSAAQSQAMEQAKAQVSQAREELRQAAEALQSSQPSAAQALSSGSRAEKQLAETRDELRKQSAARFEETMKSMVTQARELERQQEKLAAQTLGNDAEAAKPSSIGSENPKEEQGGLRPGTDGEPQEEVSRQQAWTEQREKLSALLQQMQDAVTDAEPSEPLLAEKLYDTFRETKQRDVENQLDLVPRLIDRGMAGPVQQTLEEIEGGMRQLREGVEEAAEKVLGSEVEGLRRALIELDKFDRAIREEIAGRQPSSAESAPSENTSNPPSPGNGSPQESTPPSDENASSQPGSSSPKQATDPSQPSDSPGTSTAAAETRSGEPAGNERAGNARTGTERAGGNDRDGGLANLLESSSAPITGNRFSEWSDGLRDVEESIRDAELRGRAARIRQAARDLHRDYVRHSKEPEWDLVRQMVAKPLSQLKEAVQAELLRKSAERNAVVPIDRDPVPSVFEQRLRRYYENLGSQRK